MWEDDELTALHPSELPGASLSEERLSVYIHFQPVSFTVHLQPRFWAKIEPHRGIATPSTIGGNNIADQSGKSLMGVEQRAGQGAG
ncbi:MAG: hypothetical protein ACRDYX_16645 [Egibacteraceae bacterium]